MSRPKVGDRVTVSDSSELSDMRGKSGVLLEDDGSSFPFRVEIDGDDDEYGVWLRENEVDPYAPQVFRLEVPAEPAVGSRVRPVHAGTSDRVFVRGDDLRWRCAPGAGGFTWDELLSDYPSGVELVAPESEYDAAVRWFGERPEQDARHLRYLIEDNHDAKVHASVIVRDALAKRESA